MQGKKTLVNTILEYKLWMLNTLLYINQQSKIQGVHVEAIISYWKKIKVIIIYSGVLHYLHASFALQIHF